MFGIGFPEMIVILVVALIVVGPDKLPELARSLAKGVNELRGAMNQIKESLNEETQVINSVKDDLQQATVQMKDKLLAEELGGPRQPTDEDSVIEMEADLAEEESPRSWEDDAATLRRKQQKEQEAAASALDDSEKSEETAGAEEEAVKEDAELEAGEKRVIGKNPELPASE